MKTFKRYLCKCDDTWMACAYEAEKGCIGVEYGSERKQIFHYVFKGSARVGKLFGNDSRIIDFPAPVSPVNTHKPMPKSISILSINIKLLIDRCLIIIKVNLGQMILIF